MLCGRAPRSPVLLSTLVVRFGREVPPASESLLFFRRQSRNAASARAASPTKLPMTMPAIAPPDNPSRWIGSVFDELPGAGNGVDVTVCVTLAPDTVTTRTLVYAEVVDDGVGSGKLDVDGVGDEVDVSGVLVEVGG